jgi:molecular chaperone DnaK (HSP70)
MDLMGHQMTSEEVADWKQANFVMSEIKEDERGLPGWVVKNKEEEEILYTEEVLAMLFRHGKKFAEKQAGAQVVDCVVTVPSYFD